MKELLSESRMQRLNNYVSGGQYNLIPSSLKLWTAMSEFGEGKRKQVIMEGFRWGSKAGPTDISSLCDNSDIYRISIVITRLAQTSSGSAVKCRSI